MYSLGVIKQMNEKAARVATLAKQQPYVITGQEVFPPFPFPNFGDYRPEGWELINRLFVDSSGWGSPGEPALTSSELIKRLVVGHGYAIIEEGQFQVYIGEFVRADRLSCRFCSHLIWVNRKDGILACGLPDKDGGRQHLGVCENFRQKQIEPRLDPGYVLPTEVTKPSDFKKLHR